MMPRPSPSASPLRYNCVTHVGHQLLQFLLMSALTFSGRGTNCKDRATSSPCAKAHLKNWRVAFDVAVLLAPLGTRTNVAVAIGQLCSPGMSVRSTAKFGTVQSALSAAAANVSPFGSTNRPALFWIWTVESWLATT